MNQQHSEAGSTRRQFLKTAAAGSALAANLGLLSNVHAAGSDEIRVGLIGCGGRGTGAADNVLHAAPNVKIVAIGDVFKFRVDQCRRELQNKSANREHVKELKNTVDLPEERCFAGLDCHEKVINSDANYIILATPPGFRPMHIQAVVAAGKNLFTEKPVATDAAGARKVLAAYDESQKKGLHIAAGTQRRHQRGYIEVMKRIHDGAIGDITALRCYWNGNGIWFRSRDELAKLGEPTTDLAYQMHNWYHFVWTCGDHIVEQHVHNLDVCNWAIGKHPIRAVAMGARTVRPNRHKDPNIDGQIFDQFAVDYEYDNGVHMQSMCRHIPNTPGNVSEAVAGTKGTVRTVDPGVYVVSGKQVLSREEEKSAANPYVQEHSDLIESIRKGGTPLNELQNVAFSTLTAIMGRHAAYTGKLVTWDFLMNKSKEDLVPEKLEWNMSLPSVTVPVPGRTPLA